MIIYSESFHVEHSVEEDWAQWVKDILIPQIKNTKKFKQVTFCKVISHSDDSGNTYSLQYLMDNKNLLKEYYENDSHEINLLIMREFGQKVLSFKTELELIETFKF